MSDDAGISGAQFRGLTRKNLRVVRLRCEGLQNKEVARELFLSPQTVKNHLTSVFRKLGVSGGSGVAAVCYWLGRYDAGRGS